MENSIDDKKRLSLNIRLGSMFVDHFIMCAIIVPPLIALKLIHNKFETSPIEKFAFYLMALIYFNKDFVNGKSAAKRIFGLRVVDRKTGETANEFKCFLRNITIPIWPLEVLISFFSRTRRLGDLIANTKIGISNKEEPSSIFSDIKNKKMTLVTLKTLVAGIVYMGMLWYLMDRLMKI